MKAIRILFVIKISFLLFLLFCQVANFIKLIKCDFKEPWKGEIIHSIGLTPGLSMFTVWNNDK